MLEILNFVHKSKKSQKVFLIRWFEENSVIMQNSRFPAFWGERKFRNFSTFSTFLCWKHDFEHFRTFWHEKKNFEIFRVFQGFSQKISFATTDNDRIRTLKPNPNLTRTFGFGACLSPSIPRPHIHPLLFKNYIYTYCCSGYLFEILRITTSRKARLGRREKKKK